MAVSLAGLAGFWLHLHYRRRDRGASRIEQEQMESLVSDLQGEIGAVASELHERMDQMHERIDFTERLLTDRSVRSVDLHHPKEVTPV